MAYQPVENTVQVELRYQYFGENVENTLMFYNEDGVTLSNMQDLADFIDNWWATAIRPLQATALVYRETYLTDLTTEISPTYTSTVNAGLAGTQGGGAGMPGNVTVCVSFRTPNRGRSGRGRNYFVGLGENVVTGNTVAAGTLTSIVLAYEELLMPLVDPYRWVVVSRYHDGALRAEGFVQTVTNVLVVDADVDSQRRRLPGRGN